MPKEKKENKLHLKVIRDNQQSICPFGFNIPFGCNNAGDLVFYLKPASSEIEIKNNQQALEKYNPQEKCPFADQILDIKNKVICKFPEDQKKIEMPAGSPLYQKPMSGTLMTGLMTFPLGYYNDNSIDKNYYYGYYSMESLSEYNDDIINKTAIKKDFDKAILKLSKIGHIYRNINKKNNQ